jgi:hypothetical protein
MRMLSAEVGRKDEVIKDLRAKLTPIQDLRDTLHAKDLLVFSQILSPFLLLPPSPSSLSLSLSRSRSAHTHTP